MSSRVGAEGECGFEDIATQNKLSPLPKPHVHSSHPCWLKGRCHDAIDERAGSGPPTTRPAVERREAQRPGGGPRKLAIAGRARLGAGFATPS